MVTFCVGLFCSSNFERIAGVMLSECRKSFLLNLAYASFASDAPARAAESAMWRCMAAVAFVASRRASSTTAARTCSRCCHLRPFSFSASTSRANKRAFSRNSAFSARISSSALDASPANSRMALASPSSSAFSAPEMEPPLPLCRPMDAARATLEPRCDEGFGILPAFSMAMRFRRLVIESRFSPRARKSLTKIHRLLATSGRAILV
mmetsp:Transcript_536/g.1299  ORF Transcript_536/g.1299 Transcript_536/m.1299 type:complete len:208 (+) Transcript_536:540-1163(+)